MTAVPETDTGTETSAPRPQDDLFRHVNGTWLSTAEIPADRSADGAFYQLRDAAEADSRAIIEDAAAQAANAEPGSTVQLIGDLYRSFMARSNVAQWIGSSSPPRRSRCAATASSGLRWMSGQCSL